MGESEWKKGSNDSRVSVIKGICTRTLYIYRPMAEIHIYQFAGPLLVEPLQHQIRSGSVDPGWNMHA